MAYFDTCPRCGSDDISGNRRQAFAHCEACGFESAAGEALPDCGPDSCAVVLPPLLEEK